ncbi:MAG: transporter substrate-binding domain-containing protein [Clostridia bacterium]|nr:transporter substrate-binding domain-containing protein [Clostridia bacterium]
MKRIFSFLLAVLMLTASVLALASCKKSDTAAIEEKGYFVCGITYYAPMNYFDDEGNLVGFDTEFAEAVAEELGLEVKFQLIQWGSKYNELNSGAIDLIWNGFTYGNETLEDGTSVPRSDYVDFTHSYLNNTQCVVMKASDLAGIDSLDDLAGMAGAAEAASSGEGVVKGIEGATLTSVAAQTNALMEVKGGQAKFAVIDLLMAESMVGKAGTDYADLAIVSAIELDAEVYAIGLRKGSDFTAKVNAAIEKLSEDGTLATIAAKYGLANALIPNIGK